MNQASNTTYIFGSTTPRRLSHMDYHDAEGDQDPEAPGGYYDDDQQPIFQDGRRSPKRRFLSSPQRELALALSSITHFVNQPDQMITPPRRYTRPSRCADVQPPFLDRFFICNDAFDVPTAVMTGVRDAVCVTVPPQRRAGPPLALSACAVRAATRTRPLSRPPARRCPCTSCSNR